MNILKSIKEILSDKAENTMWENLNSLLAQTETHSFESICAKGEHVYACVDNNDICVLMLDTITTDVELADESIFMAWQFPLYFTESSQRHSPVFRLHSICEGIRTQHGFDTKRVSGVLLTTSTIINMEDMEELWSHLDISVKHVKEMKAKVTLSPTNGTWDNVRKYLSEKGIEALVNRSQYKDYIDKIIESIQTSKAVFKEKNCKQRRKELRLEDIIDQTDPIFHTLGPDGNATFISANLPPIQVLAPMQGATESLNSMIGLNEIKEHINRIKNLVLFKKKIADFPGVQAPEISLHGIFAGNSGTGKTTVGLLYASVLKEAGVLSKGHLLLANGRNSFMQKWVGSEEKNVRMALAAAKGSVLLIDEAYTLVNPNEMDYARNVLPMMLSILANEEYRDIAVILCGYTKEMETVLDSNPGLRSRFPNYFLFNDYSSEELYQMAIKRIEDNGYILSNSAAVKLEALISQMYLNRIEGKWSNGREITNLYDKILINHSCRCISEDIEGSHLITITEEDIPEIQVKEKCKTRKIGFC